MFEESPAPPLAAIRAVAFDLDGTLLDTIHDLAQAANRMLEALGHPPLPKSQLRAMVGKGMPNLVRRALAASTGGEPDAQRLAAALDLYQRCYAELLGEQTLPFPGVVEGLDALRARGLPLACITNKMHRFAVLHLEHLGLADRFDVVIGGDSLPAKKPDPLPLLHVARHFGIAPHELLMVGDSRNDTDAARAAGCPSLVVPWGYREGLPLEALGADGIVGSLLELAALLRSRAP